jgi:hypothetical protein
MQPIAATIASIVSTSDGRGLRGVACRAEGRRSASVAGSAVFVVNLDRLATARSTVSSVGVSYVNLGRLATARSTSSTPNEA